MFTGSVATGKRIAEAAAKNLTPVVLELGGKDPMIVFDDANLELAASAAVWGAFCNSGQTCASVERLYVQNTIADEFTRLVVEKTRNLRQDSGAKETTDVGAMISENQLKIVESHVESFAEEGAKILTGGRRNANFAGMFFEPTVIADAKNSMRGMRDETFGPTLPIAVFESEEEAIKLANDSEFGLTASVWTKKRSARRTRRAAYRSGDCLRQRSSLHARHRPDAVGRLQKFRQGQNARRARLKRLVAAQHIHVNRTAFVPNIWWMPFGATAIETFRGLARHFSSGSLWRTTRLAPLMLKRIKELRRR
jgi:succinate-semialdehyde dehydrogenase/glutarate-semialdehyde dehydrogenase